MGPVTCVVIANHPGVRTAMEAALASLGLQVRALSGLGELPATLKDTPVGGILLELATAIKASQQEKEAANELMRFYPFARFRVVGEEVRVLGQEKSLEAFARQCGQFTPRGVRRESRVNRNLAVYLARGSEFEDAEEAITINVSRGGCFVYSIREWKIGSVVWLRFLGDQVAISGTVCYWHAWGNNKVMPGIGIKFIVPSPFAETETVVDQESLSKMPAAPMPPPTHIVTMP
ncbi:PilZ domain-containing protein [Acidobacteria bacterium AB60]|nr:PilZ domain-containing protein [Acidobacteria bacterium AB60]